jgi:hypothetical protein
VRAVYRPGAPLEATRHAPVDRFLGLRVGVGVRVGKPYEGDREIDGQPAHVFGWAYWTLDGHFEQGEMHYEVRKWLDSGDVEFRLRAVSRPAETGPWMLRTGFRLVGRPISCASTVRSAGASGD